MHRRIICAAALAAVAIFAAVGSASAAIESSSADGVRFDVGEGRTVAVGGVTSSSRRCLEGRKVIFRARTEDGNFVKLGTDSTSANGGFIFRVRLPEGLVGTSVKVRASKPAPRIRCAPTFAPITPVEQGPGR